MALPDSLVEGIRSRVEVQTRERSQPSFNPGDRVIIHGGPLHGLEAVFDGTLNGPSRVRVLVEVVNRLAPVDLHIAYLRPAS
jgi:transcription antitermination factor NusG